MGLDQFAYTAAKQQDAESRELAYWRKHPNLQGWMEELWLKKLAAKGDKPQTSEWGSTFNGVELELTWDDLVQLEKDILENNLPETQGFFFGQNSDDHYRQQDLDFVRKGKAEIFSGLRVFYNSSW